MLNQVKIAKVLAAREQQQRKRNLTKYIPDAARAIFTVLEKMSESDPKGPKRRRLQQQIDILQQVARKEVRMMCLMPVVHSLLAHFMYCLWVGSG